MKIDWKRKLASRKLWVTLIGFVTALLVAFGVQDITVTQITGVMSAMVPIVAYIIGEGVVDAAGAKTEAPDNGGSVSAIGFAVDSGEDCDE